MNWEQIRPEYRWHEPADKGVFESDEIGKIDVEKDDKLTLLE